MDSHICFALLQYKNLLIVLLIQVYMLIFIAELSHHYCSLVHKLVRKHYFHALQLFFPVYIVYSLTVRSSPHCPYTVSYA